MIPKIVHQLWLDPDENARVELPKDVRRNAATWTQHHSSVDHRLWTMSSFLAAFSDTSHDRLKQALQAAKFPTMKANLVRLALVIEFGGFWSDLKNFVDRPFLDEVAHSNLILVEHQPMPDAPPRGYFTNSFLGATPAHPFLIELLEEAISGVERRDQGSLSKVTGLVLLNDLMKRRRASGKEPAHKFLSRETAWQHYMHRVSASYQSGGRHWSEMQKHTSLYIDK